MEFEPYTWSIMRFRASALRRSATMSVKLKAKLWCYYTQLGQRKSFISPIPRKGILAVVNCQLLVDSYEMEIDSAEN